MKLNFLNLILLIVITPILSFGQIKDSSINILQCEMSYSLQFPGGDLSNRFGINSSVGIGLTYKMRSNWTIGFEVNYLFGGKVKEDSILNHLKVKSGEIINKFGEYGVVSMTERGFYTGIKAGKIFPVGHRPNKNSGIVLNIGGGLLQHKIHIENKDNNTPPVLKDYKKGYDRLTNGLALREFIGYQYLDNNRLINFYAGLEFYQAWTKCRRDFNFDTMQKDNTSRNDYIFGIKAGWILPLYQRKPDTYYYY